jgi:hypothetical protein
MPTNDYVAASSVDIVKLQYSNICKGCCVSILFNKYKSILETPNNFAGIFDLSLLFSQLARLKPLKPMDFDLGLLRSTKKHNQSEHLEHHGVYPCIMILCTTGCALQVDLLTHKTLSTRADRACLLTHWSLHSSPISSC